MSGDRKRSAAKPTKTTPRPYLRIWMDDDEVFHAEPGSVEAIMELKESGWSRAGDGWTADSLRPAARFAEYADGSCAQLLKDYRDSTARRTAASRAVDAEIEIPLSGWCVEHGLDYYPYQRAGVAFMRDHRSALVGDEMGVGKTIEAVGLINLLPEIRRVLVVCPATLKVNWRNELRHWLARKMRVRIAFAGKWPEADIVVVNYDILQKESVAEGIESTRWDLLVIDECSAVKNPKAKRTKATLAIRARRRIFLTGTPILNRPAELWSILHSLDPKRWSNFFEYARRYCRAHKAFGHWDFGGASRLDELQDRLRSTVMIRRLKKDVLAELPPKTRQIIELPADDVAEVLAEERRTWEESARRVKVLKAAFEKAKISDDEGEYHAALESLRTGQAFCLAEISKARHRVALEKVPFVIQHLREMLSDGKKVVCFAHHLDVIGRIASPFGESAVVVVGKTPQRERAKLVRRFQENDEVRLFVGGFKVAGLGLTLTAADRVVFAELDWTPATITQAEDRLHRIGQEGNVLVQHLVLESSLDAKMAKTLVRKQEIADRALDNQLGDEKESPRERCRVRKALG